MLEPFEFIHIHSCGDATSIYDVRIKKEMSVRELIDYALSKNDEWGFIEIDDDRKFEFRYGKVVSDSLTADEKDYIIKDMIWSGGWTRADYTIFKNKKKPKFK